MNILLDEMVYFFSNVPDRACEASPLFLNILVQSFEQHVLIIFASLKIIPYCLVSNDEMGAKEHQYKTLWISA